jgi:hypothetical protein
MVLGIQELFGTSLCVIRVDLLLTRQSLMTLAG